MKASRDILGLPEDGLRYLEWWGELTGQLPGVALVSRLENAVTTRTLLHVNEEEEQRWYSVVRDLPGAASLERAIVCARLALVSPESEGAARWVCERFSWADPKAAEVAAIDARCWPQWLREMIEQSPEGSLFRPNDGSFSPAIAWDLVTRFWGARQDRREWGRRPLRSEDLVALFVDRRQDKAADGRPEYTQKGMTANLRLELLPGGRGHIYPDPESLLFVRQDVKFREALESARHCARELLGTDLEGQDVRWSLTRHDGQPLSELFGGSAGAAFAIGLTVLSSGSPDLMRLELSESKVGVAAELTSGPEGWQFAPVASESEKLWAAAQQAEFVRIVCVAPGQSRSDYPNLRVIEVPTLRKLVEVLYKERKRRVRRRRLRLALTVTAVLALLWRLLWVWDYNRLKVADYANIGARWGVPEGVGALDAKTVMGRQSHFRVETRRGKVRRVLCVNSVGTLSNAGAETDCSDAIQVISYREDGSVEQIDVRDHNEQLSRRERFTERHETKDGSVQYVDLRAEHRDKPLALDAGQGGLGLENPSYEGRASEITAYEILYDASGRPSRIMYVNAQRDVRPNAEGVFGHQLTYDDSSLLHSGVASLGPDGTPKPGRNGRLRLSLLRNKFGDITEERYLGAHGEPEMGSAGCHRKERRRDSYGNVTQFACFGLADEPATYPPGFHKSTQSFDARGNLIGWAHFGIDGRPILDRDGVHSCTRRFDSRGHVIDWAFFGIDGKPVWHNDGYHRGTAVFDARGSQVETSYFGIDNTPTVCGDGYHKLSQVADARGNAVEWSYYGIDGHPTLNGAGVHMIKLRYDPRYRNTGQAFFGVDRRPAVDRSGVHRSTQIFDDGGNLIEESFFGADDRPTSRTDGVHRVTQTFDAGGNLTTVAYFGVDDKPVLVRGYHSYHITANQDRTQVDVAFYDMDGKATLGVEGFHKRTGLLDAGGNDVADQLFGLDGEPVLHRDGFHKIEYLLDPLGNRIEVSFFDIQGEPVTTHNGFHRVKSRFDARGNEIEESFFGIGGKPAGNLDGVHRIVRRYDSQRNLTELSQFLLDGKSRLALTPVDLGLMSLSGMEARFQQRVRQKGFTKERVESGVVTFGDYPRMRWSYEKPEVKLFIFDGMTSWVSVEGSPEVTALYLDRSSWASLPFLFLSDSAWLSANYAVFEERRGNIESTQLHARKSNLSIPDVIIDRNLRDGLIYRIEYRDHKGSRTIFELSDHRSVPVPPKLFQYTPPKNAKIVTVPAK